jgi:hypothetical protein
MALTNGLSFFAITPDPTVRYSLTIFKSDDGEEGKEFPLPQAKYDKDMPPLPLDLSVMLKNSAGLGNTNDEEEQTLDLTFHSNQGGRPEGIPEQIPMRVQILNKDKVVYEETVTVDATTEVTPYTIKSNLYENAPNGGVLILKIASMENEVVQEVVELEEIDYSCNPEVDSKDECIRKEEARI